MWYEDRSHFLYGILGISPNGPRGKLANAVEDVLRLDVLMSIDGINRNDIFANMNMDTNMKILIMRVIIMELHHV